jgi:hypothetical protein
MPPKNISNVITGSRAAISFADRSRPGPHRPQDDVRGGGPRRQQRVEALAVALRGDGRATREGTSPITRTTCAARTRPNVERANELAPAAEALSQPNQSQARTWPAMTPVTSSTTPRRSENAVRRRTAEISSRVRNGMADMTRLRGTPAETTVIQPGIRRCGPESAMVCRRGAGSHGHPGQAAAMEPRWRPSGVPARGSSPSPGVAPSPRPMSLAVETGGAVPRSPAPAAWIALATASSPSMTRGPGRATISSSSATTRPSRTAFSAPHPGDAPGGREPDLAVVGGEDQVGIPHEDHSSLTCGYSGRRRRRGSRPRRRRSSGR